MKRRPKYTTACQSLINACQAAELIKGVSVTLTMDTANDITRQLPPREFQMFDIQQAGRDAFTVRLRDDQPQPTPQ